MTLKTIIQDGSGTRRVASVGTNRALLVTRIGEPPMIQQDSKIFRQYLTDDGTPSGSNDMTVDGSTTHQDFWIEATREEDTYITYVVFTIAYASAANLAEWCDSAAALTNGFRFFYARAGEEIDIDEAMTTNGNFVKMGGDPLVTEWEAQDVASTNDYGIIVTVPFARYMPPYGLKLHNGSAERLVFRVRDDNTTATSGCDEMNALAFGFQRFNE